jgi:fumarate reductase subunit C
MAHNPHYSKYRPRWYRARVPIFWWVHKWTYARFILRELTSVFVALYALVLLFHIRALAQGPEAYASFVVWLKTPGALAMHVIAFVFVVFHSITWFNLAPKALVLHLGKKRVPDAAIAALNYVAWGVVSVVIAWILLAV